MHLKKGDTFEGEKPNCHFHLKESKRHCLNDQRAKSGTRGSVMLIHIRRRRSIIKIVGTWWEGFHGDQNQVELHVNGRYLNGRGRCWFAEDREYSGHDGLQKDFCYRSPRPPDLVHVFNEAFPGKDSQGRHFAKEVRNSVPKDVLQVVGRVYGGVVLPFKMVSDVKGGVKGGAKGV